MALASETSQIGSKLRAARENAGMTQSAAAVRLGIDSVTLSRWERGVQSPKHHVFGSLAAIYNVPRAYFEVEDSEADPSDPPDLEEWAPNPSLAGVVTPRVYEVAIAYCRRLAAAGLPREDVEEAERLLIDEGYAKLNKRAKRVLTEDEQIELIDATWRIMREALSWRGMRA
jgi:transcriptional regulator with XRE-family HTH domain